MFFILDKHKKQDCVIFDLEYLIFFLLILAEKDIVRKIGVCID